MKKITLKNKEYFESQKPVYQFISCEYSFANLAMWGGLYDVRYQDKDGIPLIYIGRDQDIIFPQIPGIQPEALAELSKEIIKEGGSGNISQAPEEYVLEHPSLKNYFEISENNAFSDYIHSTERLSLLQGKKLRKKRNLISQFVIANPEYNIDSLKSEFFDDCLNMAKGNIGLQGKLDKNEELQAMTNGFSMFEELALDGIVLYVKHKLIAFSIFSKNIDGSYVVHFEKNDRDYKGSAQLINQKTAEYLTDKCEFINREQDLGIEGLRKAKRSYDPDTTLINYELIPK